MNLRAQIDEYGFAVLPDVVPDEALNGLEVALRTLPRSRAGLRHAMRIKAVAEFANSPRLVAIASQVLGGAAIPFRATLFDKSPDANWLVVWHQDTALPLKTRRDVPGWGPWSVKEGVDYAHAPADALARVVALRVHLDASTADNGPLRVLPGTHTKGVLDDDQIAMLARNTAAIDCVASAGYVVVMRPLIVHASSKSRSPAPRRVLHIEYAESLNVADELRLAIA